jgi:hypothetical protein
MNNIFSDIAVKQLQEISNSIPVQPGQSQNNSRQALQELISLSYLEPLLMRVPSTALVMVNPYNITLPAPQNTYTYSDSILSEIQLAAQSTSSALGFDGKVVGLVGIFIFTSSSILLVFF